MTGTADANATVAIVVDGTPTGQTVAADGTGAWSADIAGIAPGLHNVDVTTQDAANPATTLTSNTQTVTVAAPPTLALPALVGATLSVTGTTSAPGAVTLTVDGAAIGTVTPSNGAFSANLPTLAAGRHTISASQTEVLTATPGTATETVVVPHAPTLRQAVVDGRLVLSGTADPGATVTLHQQQAADRTFTASGTGTWSVTEAIPTAPAQATAEVADAFTASGVLGSVTQILPVAPTVAGSDPNAPAGTAYSAAGTAAPGATVRISVDGSAASTVLADALGAWAFDRPGPVAAGPHGIIASVVDAAGDTLATAPYTAIVASRPPVITGPVATTGAALFAVAGTADPGAAVTLSVDANAARALHVTADADGLWRASVPGTGPGAFTLIASTVDANSGAILSSAPDTVGLAGPVIGAAGFAPPSTDLIVTGTAAVGAPVTVVAGAAIPVTVIADGAGRFSANLGPQPGGSRMITASAPDPFGSQVFTSAPATVFVPSAPIILSALAGAGGAIVLNGVADAGATVTILDGTATDGSIIAATDGTWSYTIQAPGPVASVTAKVAPAGYVGLASLTVSPPYTSVPPTILGPDPSAPAASLFSVAGHATPHAPLTITLDGTSLATVTTDASGAWSYDRAAPVAAGRHVIGVRTTGTPVGSAVTAPVIVASHAPTLGTYSNATAAPGTVLSVQGTADPGATVALSADGRSLPLLVTAAADGTWSADLAGLTGTERLVATTRDANGPGSLASAPVTVSVPAPPTVFYAGAASLGGGTTLTVYGAAAPGALVTVTAGGNALGSATADATGHFGLAVAVASGVGLATITASIADPYAVAPLGTTVSTPYAAPAAAPAIVAIRPASPPGGSSLAVSGTAIPGATVTIAIAGTTLAATAQANADGAWSTAILSPGPGDHTLAATVPSATGALASGPSALHLAAPPTLTGEDTSGAPAGITLELHGTADPNALVAVALDGQAPVTVRANAQGVWLDPIANVAAGSHAVTLATADPTLGVTLATSGAFTLTTPAITQTRVDGAHFVTVAGTATPGETVTVTSDALAQAITALADGTGAWQAGFSSGAGSHTVVAFALDPVRNAQVASAVAAIAVPVALSAAPTDPLQVALLAAQIATTGTGLGAGLASVPAAGSLRAALIGAGQSGTVAAAPGAQLVVNTAAAPITLLGNGAANAIVHNAGGKIAFITGGGSGVFLDGTSAADDRFTAPDAGGGSYLVQLGRGNNLVEAKSGDTTVQGGAGANSIWLGSGQATISLMGVGKDTVVTGAGTASVHAIGTANELVFQGSGNLTFDNNDGTATVAGGSGSSTIHAWGGSGVFWGGSGGYSELSANSDCTLVSSGDNDHLLAWGFHNQLWAVHGNATIQAVGGGNNLLVGGDGNDWMAGFGAGDTLLGGLGNSTLWGGAGDELIHLSQKSAIVYAGNGNETLIAGAGTDQFVFFKRPGVNTYDIQGFRHGADHVSFADHSQSDYLAAIRTQTHSAAGTTLTLGDGTRLVFAGLNAFSKADLF